VDEGEKKTNESSDIFIAGLRGKLHSWGNYPEVPSSRVQGPENGPIACLDLKEASFIV
jgi:hypothetical protein